MSDAVLVDIGSAETPDGGVIRLSQWPEGFVLWYHGQIVWRSWDWPRRDATQVTITLDASGVKALIDQEITKARMDAERARRGLGRPFRL